MNDLIRYYLKSHKVMQLATIKGSRPQICTLHFAYDENYNIYWFSSVQTNHSVAISRNKETAISILHSVEQMQCFHAEGESEKVSKEELANVDRIYSERFVEDPERLDDLLSNERPSETFYVFRPKKIIIFDIKNFPKEPRQEYML